VATNAAESSVTIPDIDIVICLGRHKSLQYNEALHRTQLVSTWISKSSATQRAGRTGRVRPGAVYRLYSRKLHEKFLPHELAEVHRRPLQDVVLGLWIMLENSATFTGVTSILERLIEPPDVRNIQQSYETLHEFDLITHPSDEKGALTATGRLAGELPVDMALGRLICYGVMLGVAAEAVVIAAALSLPKSPFRFANSIYVDPDEYHSILRSTFLTRLEFDCGAYSQPIMLMRLLQT
jgi:HrpA-like RNA helicase